MKIVHLNLCTRLKPDSRAGDFSQQRENVEKLFWSDHSFPEKPAAAAGPVSAAAYKNAKAALQLEWVHMLEAWTVNLIKEALTLAVTRDTQAGGKADLYIVTLPESYWCDTEPPGRLHRDEAERLISAYHNPLYEDTVTDLLFHRNGPGTLASLSAPDVLILAGTIWWKSTDASGQDTVYNTAPVFHNGACQFLWDKQLLSGVDGLGANTQIKLHKWLTARNAHFSQIGLPAAASAEEINNHAVSFLDSQRKGFLSPLTARLNPRALPQFDLTLPAPLSFGLDICKDFIFGVSHRLLPAPPRIQAVLSNGASFRNPDSFFAADYHFICDMEGTCLTSSAVNPDPAHSPAAQLSENNHARHLTGTLFVISDVLTL